MRLFWLTALTMFAFAANSLLNRAALLDADIGPGSFAAIRLCAGVVVLMVLLGLRDKRVFTPHAPNLNAVLALAAYMLGFSYAYLALDAGLGALILFGVVQLTMFVGALIGGDRPPALRWLGMGTALLGLALLTLPSDDLRLPPLATVLMIGAGIGWGVYSLLGRSATDPLADTAWNFVYALPLSLLALLLWPDAINATPRGILLAVCSGGITSAMGYALWYSLLPSLGATRAALAQLSVPAIAVLLGALLLGETVTGTTLLAMGLILGGIMIGLLRR